MKRPAKTKRTAKTNSRQKAKNRRNARKVKAVVAPVPPSFTVPDRMLAAADLLVAGEDGGPDAHVTELFLAWSGVRVLEDVLQDHARHFGDRTHAEGRAEDDCPAWCAVIRLDHILFSPRRTLMEALAAAPAETPRGLALKLLVWRWESCHSPHGKLTEIDAISAYGAYRDALKRADLTSLAHPLDALTDAVLEQGKALEFDD